MEQHYSRENLETSSFEDGLAEIVSEPLNAENIDTYANNALDRLIGLLESAVSEYNARPTIDFLSERETEEAAFNYFGLDNVEAILDHIAARADETRVLDDYIDSIPNMSLMILPPDEHELVKVGNGGSTYEKRVIPRFKTLLFILTNEFGVNLSNESEVTITKGTNSSSSMRKESYYSVVLPVLQRQILINNEVGNATYIFDTFKLTEINQTELSILDKTKSELNELLDQFDAVGQRIVYGNTYVSDLITSINAPNLSFRSQSSAESKADKPETSYLLPTPETREQTAYELARAWGINVLTVTRAAQKLGDAVSPIPHIHGSRTWNSFLEEDQRAIHDYLVQKGPLAPQIPNEYTNISQLADRLKVNRTSLNSFINRIMDELGPVGMYKVETTTKPVKGFNPEQTTRIIELATDKEFINGVMPDDFMTREQLTQDLGISNDSLKVLEKQLLDQLGNLRRFATGGSGSSNIGYSPKQQDIFRTNNTFLTSPEGYLSIVQMQDLFGVSGPTIRSALNSAGISVEDRVKYLFNKRRVSFYSPNEQERIRKILKQNGNFAEEAPEGYLGIRAIGRDLNVPHKTIRDVIARYSNEIGQPTVYKTRGTNVPNPAFSPEQRRVIERKLSETST